MNSQTSDRSLSDSLIALNDTLDKDEGIVNTSSAHRFLNQPGEINEKYTEYARTHLIQPDVNTFIENLTSSLEDPEEDRSVPGYIVGPYGYGKTSSAGKAWHELEHERDYIATPPIYFRDLQSIVDAVYGWIRYRLDDRPDYLEELERCYEANIHENLEDLVEKTNLSNKDDVREELQRLSEEGSGLNIEFSVNNVLEFLSECNQIVKDAGFDGLVVIADELQQFVSNHSSDKEAYAELRDIAKSIALGLNEGDGLGLIFTMDEGLHSDLDINADDVLARLAEQNVTLNLSNVYGRSFSADLWDDLSDQFGFYEDRHEIITKDALDAIGQICERGPPLSNGPRTVVDLFTIAIDHRLTEEDPFDALDLADSYYTGVVRYKRDKIKSAITQALNTDVISTDAQEDFIKLCGVFPRGIPDSQLKEYGVYDAKEEVKQELHGQLIITQEEGRTLKQLKRDDEETGVKDELFTQFYREYDTSSVYDDNTAEIFRSKVITEELFPSTRGKNLNSWVTEHEFEPETSGAYAAVFRGSFNGQQYPKRLIEIRVGQSEDAVSPPTSNTDVDLHFGFVMNMEEDDNFSPHIDRPTTDTAIVHLDFRDAFETLPSNIALLEDYMSPEDVNPHLLLALYKYMESWRSDRTINPNQEEQLDYIQNQLINRSIQKLFGPPLNGDDLISDGESRRRTIEPSQVVQKVFDVLIEGVYPNYETLFISDNYSTFLESYEGLLLGNNPNLRISQKRGNRPIEGSKAEIADGIGVSSNSTAKTRLEKQFQSLANIEVWSGNDACILLTLHPLEKKLKDALESADDDRLSIEKAYEIGRGDGHRKEEVDWALRLLDAREYIDRDDGEIQLSDIALDIHEVRDQFEDLQTEVNTLEDLSEEWPQAEDIKAILTEIKAELDETAETEIEKLDEILAEIRDVQSRIDLQKERLQATYRERCDGQKEDLREYARRTQPRELSTEIQSGKVPFEMHLNDIQMDLEAQFDEATAEAEEAVSELQSAIEEASGSTSTESIKRLQEALETASITEVDLEEDFEDIENDAADYAAWCELAQDMGKTRTKMVRYVDNHDSPDRVKGLREKLDDQLTAIQNEFQRDASSALRNAGVERQKFEEIKATFDEITEAHREDFTFRKNVLEGTILRGTEGHGTIRQNLDPDDPQGSRDDLKHEFKRQLWETNGGIQDIQSSVDSVESSLEYAKMLRQVPETAEMDSGEIERRLSSIRETLLAIQNAVEQMEIQDDIPLPPEESEEFPRTDHTLRLPIDGSEEDVGGLLQTQRETIEELDETVSKWRSTTDQPPEEYDYIMQELDFRQETDLETVLVQIADRQDTDPDLESFLEDLKTLFEGSHISIKLKSEHR